MHLESMRKNMMANWKRLKANRTVLQNVGTEVKDCMTRRKDRTGSVAQSPRFRSDRYG